MTKHQENLEEKYLSTKELDKDVLNMVEKSKNMTKEEKNELLSDIHDSYEKTGNVGLMKCFNEGILTEEKWLELQKLGITAIDMGSITLAIFRRKKPDEMVVITTVRDTKIYEHRELLSKMFNIVILDIYESITLMETESKVPLDEKDEKMRKIIKDAKEKSDNEYFNNIVKMMRENEN